MYLQVFFEQIVSSGLTELNAREITRITRVGITTRDLPSSLNRALPYKYFIVI